jgi:hypothetical protein
MIITEQMKLSEDLSSEISKFQKSKEVQTNDHYCHNVLVCYTTLSILNLNFKHHI